MTSWPCSQAASRCPAYRYYLTLRPDGKIIAAGESDLLDWSTPWFGLARYNRDGSLDTTFGIGGKVRMDLPTGQFAHARFVGIQRNMTLAGLNVSDRTYFDMRFRSPRSTTDQVALNWQQGTAARHTVPAGTAAGIWIVTAVRAHELVDDHGASSCRFPQPLLSLESLSRFSKSLQ
jgi:Domain of unknown function (DUF5122) beta-propeller